MDKLSELKKKISCERKKGKKVVFTNGCFDILHYGHIRLLEKAKSKGDILVVGLNSDSSVRRLKGKERPIQNQKARLKILSSLRMVDYVVIFNELTPLKLIKAIQPDALVKGSDWKDKKVVGREVVEKRGGEVYLFPLLRGYSTTKILTKVLHFPIGNKEIWTLF